MSKILREAHLNILKKLPDFVREEYVFSGGTALAEYYFHHRLSDDIDLFALKKDATIHADALCHAVSSIGDMFYEKTHGRFLFSVKSCEEVIKLDFCPLYFPRLNEPMRLKDGYLVDSLDDIAANKILALCGRNEPKDFIDIYFFNKINGYDLQKMISLAEQKEPQAYRYLVNLDRAERLDFNSEIYKIIVDFSEEEIKGYFKEQNSLIKAHSRTNCNDDHEDQDNLTNSPS